MTQQQLADAVGVDRKTVNRWENGRAQGLGANYAKLAQALDWPSDQALRMVQGNAVLLAEEAELALHGLRTLHPLAARIGDLLGSDSPLPEGRRAVLEDALAQLLESVVRSPGSDHGIDVFVEGPYEVRWITQAKSHQPARREPPLLKFLEALVADDAPLRDSDKQALWQGISALVQLGQTAMLAHAGPLAEQHEDPEVRRREIPREPSGDELAERRH